MFNPGDKVFTLGTNMQNKTVVTVVTYEHSIPTDDNGHDCVIRVKAGFTMLAKSANLYATRAGAKLAASR